jgi:hypothetical protein
LAGRKDLKPRNLQIKAGLMAPLLAKPVILTKGGIALF